MKIIRKLSAVFDYAVGALVWFMGIILVALVLLIGISVISRYVFDSPISWVSEIIEYCLIYLGFLLAAWIMKEDKHIKMDFIISNLKPRAQNIVNIITSFICTIFCIVLTWFSFKLTLYLYLTDYFVPTVLRPPKCIFIAGIFVGLLMLSIQLIRRTYDYIIKLKTATSQTNFQEQV